MELGAMVSHPSQTVVYDPGSSVSQRVQAGLKCLVHGDDFVVSGEPVDLVWMRNELESKLEINTTILGTNQECRRR